MEWRERSEARSGKLETDITYAELNFLRASMLNVGNMSPDPPIMPAKSALVCRSFAPSGFRIQVMRWLLLAALLLILLLLTAVICLMCFYWKLNSQLAKDAAELNGFRANHTHWQQELVIERAEREAAERNHSSLEHECQVLQQQTLPKLLANNKQFQEEVEAERERTRQVTEHYEDMQEQCDDMRDNSLFLSKNSSLYLSCNKTMDPSDPSGQCTFCPDGWMVFGPRCYFYTDSEQNWESSERNCRAMNAHLAVIHSREEMKFLADLITSVTWMGLSDRDMENDWRWVDGTPYASSPKFWPRNQPDNVGNEDCVAFSRDMTWNDDKCWWLYRSVCEKAASVLHIQSGFIDA